MYPQNFEEKTGFDKIRDKIKSYTQSSASAKLVDDLSFSTDIYEIKDNLNFTGELKKIILFNSSFPLTEFPDIKPVINQLYQENSVLSEKDFYQIFTVLHVFLKCRMASRKLNSENFALIKTKFDDVEYPAFVKDEIRRIFTSRGEIKEDASKELKELYSDLKIKEQKISTELNKVLETAVKNNYTGGETSVAVIDGYRTIPVDAIYKKKINGTVIGRSTTGKTIFIEPTSVSKHNQDIKNIEHDILSEKQNILFELTENIRDYSSEIHSCLKCLSIVDFQRAKAKFAIDIDAIIPAVHESGTIKFHKARHPVLVMFFKNTERKVIPFELELNTKNRLIVISGPNAGGKSVTLQAVGLLQYMIQCGIQVPVGGNTETRILNDIYLDFGDDQSISNDLSTYSSHLKNMNFMLNNADENKMILIDEFGDGTEPEMGAAIAEAILQNFADSGVLGILTTHYANLKRFSNNYPGIENAAMLFDNEKIKPLYKLQTGIPGSSYTFEIAKNSGLPKEIIELAESKTDKKQFDFDKHLKKVIKDKKYWENKREEIDNERRKLFAELNRHSIAYQGFERQKEKIIKEAKEEAAEMIQKANKEIEKTIRIIKEEKAEKEKTKKARQQLEKEKEKIKKSKPEIKNTHEIKNFKNSIENTEKIKKPQKVENLPVEIRPGSNVLIKDLDQEGEVIDVGEKSYVISIGDMITTVEKNRVVPQEDGNKSHSRRSKQESTYFNHVMKFQSRLDLRGKRVNEALQELMEFIDNAVVVQAKEVKILHGKGNGILRQAVRDYLSGEQDVESFGDEDIRQGGDGITVVNLRI